MLYSLYSDFSGGVCSVSLDRQCTGAEQLLYFMAAGFINIMNILEVKWIACNITIKIITHWS